MPEFKDKCLHKAEQLEDVYFDLKLNNGPVSGETVEDKESRRVQNFSKISPKVEKLSDLESVVISTISENYAETPWADLVFPSVTKIANEVQEAVAVTVDCNGAGRIFGANPRTRKKVLVEYQGEAPAVGLTQNQQDEIEIKISPSNFSDHDPSSIEENQVSPANASNDYYRPLSEEMIEAGCDKSCLYEDDSPNPKLDGDQAILIDKAETESVSRLALANLSQEFLDSYYYDFRKFDPVYLKSYIENSLPDISKPANLLDTEVSWSGISGELYQLVRQTHMPEGVPTLVETSKRLKRYQLKLEENGVSSWNVDQLKKLTSRLDKLLLEQKFKK